MIETRDTGYLFATLTHDLPANPIRIASLPASIYFQVLQMFQQLCDVNQVSNSASDAIDSVRGVYHRDDETFFENTFYKNRFH